jgi:hypothetical protein
MIQLNSIENKNGRQTPPISRRYALLASHERLSSKSDHHDRAQLHRELLSVHQRID